MKRLIESWLKRLHETGSFVELWLLVVLSMFNVFYIFWAMSGGRLENCMGQSFYKFTITSAEQMAANSGENDDHICMHLSVNMYNLGISHVGSILYITRSASKI